MRKIRYRIVEYNADFKQFMEYSYNLHNSNFIKLIFGAYKKIFFINFFLYIKMASNYYQKHKEKLQKNRAKDMKVFLRKKQKNSVIKIFHTKKSKMQLSKDEIIIQHIINNYFFEDPGTINFFISWISPWNIKKLRIFNEFKDFFTIKIFLIFFCCSSLLQKPLLLT